LAQDNLGLDELERRVFEEILNGQITERNENNETIITQLGRKTEQGVIHHPGQELILSAPKSVSIMGLVAEDDRVLEAHEKAVDEIVRYLERTMVYTRVQKHGEMQLEHTNNILAAKFTHLTSRPPISNQDQNQKEADPQIHTHVIIPNATKCRDGVWRSIVFDELYANKMHLGELYRMELAQNLQKLGYDIRLQQDRLDF
jgi:conjugative relaxase-like TrwC/TraI family protein